MLLRVIAPELAHATSVGRAALDDAVLACLARRPRDIPSTLGYFHAIRREDTESERASSASMGRASLYACSDGDMTAKRQRPTAKPYKAGIGRTPSGIVGISLDLSSIRGRDSRTGVREPKIQIRSTCDSAHGYFYRGDGNSNAMQNPSASRPLSSGK